MSPKIYVLLAKYGDITSFLPVMAANPDARLMVSAKYADILEGVSYANPIIFDGEPHELDKAVAFAQKFSPIVQVVQVSGPPELTKKYCYGPTGTPHATTTSFVHEMWRLGGRTDFSHSPPVFDRRSPEREAVLMERFKKRRALIGVAVDSASSPFAYKPLLMELLKRRFSHHFLLLDFAEVKAERFYDLLPLLEKCRALVAADSAILHLASALPRLPVCALVNDKPNHWHGSPWRPNHIYHCRYSKFPERAVEMLDAIEGLGSAGSPFIRPIASPRLIHAWSGYQDGHTPAVRLTWQFEYQTNHWVETQIEPGSVGRDSRSQLHDEQRLPFLRDVLDMAAQRAGSDDQIVLTRPDTAFVDGLTMKLLEHPLSYAHRTENGSYHPAVDLFSMTKRFWMDHRMELPDFLFGRDCHWHRVMAEWLKANGAKELPFAIEKLI